MKRASCSALAFVILVSCSASVPAPLLDPMGNGAARERWLFDQRAYPFGDIPADARRLALKEVQRRERQSANATTLRWRPIGPLPVQTNWPWKTATGRVKAVAVSPQDSGIVLAGSSSGGIWRSTDAGRTFIPVSDTHSDLSVGTIAFAPSDPRIVYAVSGSDFLGTGVLKSFDAGATWHAVDGPSFAPRGTASRMAIDPADPDRLWVAQTSAQDAASGNVFASGLLQSDDGGFSWTRLFQGLISDFAAAPVSPTTFLLGISRHDGGGVPGLYRTADGGRSWSLVLPGTGSSPRFTFAFSPVNRNRVYLHSLMSNAARIHVSHDGGATWTELSGTVPPGRVSFLTAHPSRENQLYLGYPGGDLYESADGGLTWRNVTLSRDEAGKFVPALSLTHIDQHALVFAPGDARVMYLGNDGGIYKSTDGGITFTSLAPALSLVQGYRVDAHPVDPSMLFLGMQDNGLGRQRAAGWRELITGDYGSTLFDINNPSRLITNYVFGTTIAFSANGDNYLGQRSTSATFGEDAVGIRIQFIAPFEQHKRTNTLYFGTWRLFTSTDFGVTWAAPSGTFDPTRGGFDSLSAIGLAESDPNTVYTGSAEGRVMITRDGGVSWTDITAGLPNRHVKAIAVDAGNPNAAWIAFSGYRTAHVYRTADAGATWQEAGSGLPDVPVNALLLHDGAVYGGTDIGPFRLTGNYWEFIGTGMPPVVVTSFDVTAAGKIVASTYGRGVYELVTGTDEPPRRRSVRH